MKLKCGLGAGATIPEVLAAAAALGSQLVKVQLISATAPDAVQGSPHAVRRAYKGAWLCYFSASGVRWQSSSSNDVGGSRGGKILLAVAVSGGDNGQHGQEQQGCDQGQHGGGGPGWLVVRCGDVLGQRNGTENGVGGKQGAAAAVADGGGVACTAAAGVGGQAYAYSSEGRRSVGREDHAYRWVMLLRLRGGSQVNGRDGLHVVQGGAECEAAVVVGCTEEDVLAVGGVWAATGAALVRARVMAASMGG